MKPTALKALRLLQQNETVTTHDLLECGAGSRYGQRLAELRAAGYVIDAWRERQGSWRYRLVSSPKLGVVSPDGSEGEASPARQSSPATVQAQPLAAPPLPAGVMAVRAHVRRVGLGQATGQLSLSLEAA